MTTNLLEKKNDNALKEAMRLIAIGAEHANLFSCPACSRPLEDGTSRCPDCGTRLVMGVRLKRVVTFLALGIIVGFLIGGATTAAAITLSLKDPVAATKPVATAAPGVVPPTTPVATGAPGVVTPTAPVATGAPGVVTPTTPVATGAPGVVTPTAAPSVVAPPEVAAPVAAVSALSGTAVVNGRIAVDAATLAAVLGRSNATSIELARALRSLAADAALGIDLAGRLAPWTDAAKVQSGLDDFYRAMAQEARTGLRASLNDEGAYRKAGASMLKVLATMGAVDAQSRDLAGTIGLEIPPVVVPAS